MYEAIRKPTRTAYFSNCLGVFQGGGCRAAAYVGAFSEAIEHGVYFSEVAGTSAGAIVAALIGAGASPEYLHEKIGTLNFSQFMSEPQSTVKSGIFRFASKKLSYIETIMKKTGLYCPDPIGRFVEKCLQEILNTRKIVKFSDLKLPTYIIATDLSTGRIKVWGPEDVDASVSSAVKASCSIPFFFQPAEKRYIDGGVLSNLPAFVFKNKSNAPAARRVLAFALQADHVEEASVDNGEILLQRIQDAIVDGAQALQESLVPTSKIVIKTGTIKATDFAQITNDTLRDLIKNGKDAAAKFFEEERTHIGRIVQHRIIGGRHELLSTAIDLGRDDMSRIVISEQNTNFVWDIFPTLARWVEAGVSVEVLVPDIDSNRTTERQREEYRRGLLRAMGATVAPRCRAPARAWVYFNHQGSYAAITALGSKMDESEPEAVVYNGRLDQTAIVALERAVLQDFEDQHTQRRDRFEVTSADCADVINRLKSILFYRNAELTFEKVNLADMMSLTPYVHEYKYKQIPYLIDISSRFGNSPFTPAQLRFNHGKYSLVTPPVVEECNGKYYLIEGTTRAKYFVNTREPSMYAIVVRNCKEAFPGEPVPLDRVRIVSYTVRDKDRYGAKFNYDLFRKIEESVHLMDDVI